MLAGRTTDSTGRRHERRECLFFEVKVASLSNGSQAGYIIIGEMESLVGREPQKQSCVVKAPAIRNEPAANGTIFLGGSISKNGTGNWRQFLVESSSLSGKGVVFYDPSRDDWDHTWKEDMSDERWVQQVDWEGDRITESEVIVFYFGAATDAPITLLEFGTVLGTSKRHQTVVCVDPAYSKAGYVELHCMRQGVTFVDDVEQLPRLVSKKLGRVLAGAQERRGERT